MRKATKLYILLGVLAVICAAAFAVGRWEDRKEQIKNSGEVILEIPADSVTALSWENESGTFAFTKGENGWVCDADTAFPVDESAIRDLLEQFAQFSAAFVIEDVEDNALYGLDDPVCTISITTAEETCVITLGDISKMDEQRYLSIGDGKAYLVAHDPLEEFDAVLSDMILHDDIPDLDTVNHISFTGTENYTISLDEETESICVDDIYFADGAPLDTSLVKSYLSTVSALTLSNYVTYNATEDELSDFGLDTPSLTIQIGYPEEDGTEGSFVLHLGQNVEELAAYKAAAAEGDDDLPSVTCYARVGDSRIIYKITDSRFETLTAVSYDDLRHQKLFTGDFDAVTAMDVTLDGETYTFTPGQEDDDLWLWQEQQFDISTLRAAIQAITADSFTDISGSGQEEISLTLHLDSESFPTFTLTLRRQDGERCLAEVDGQPTAYVSRSLMVDLAEAVNAVVLGS